MQDGQLRDALRIAMIEALRADTDANTLSGGRVYPEEDVPADAEFPRYYLGFRPGQINYIGGGMKDYYVVVAVMVAAAKKSMVDVAGTMQDMLAAAQGAIHRKLTGTDVPGLRWVKFSGEEQTVPSNVLLEQFAVAADRYTGYFQLTD